MRTLTRAFVLAASLAVGTAWAGQDGLQGTDPAAGSDTGLAPRQPVAKVPSASLRMPDDFTGELRVKFVDAAKVRLRGGSVASLSNRDVDPIQAIVGQFGLTVQPGINHNEDRLMALELLAAARSGRAQPDLAGMMIITGPAENMLDAARALNDLDSVEWVELTAKRYPPMRGFVGACCLPDDTCVEVDSQQCQTMGGVYQGIGTTCGQNFCSGACCVPSAVDCVDTDMISCSGLDPAAVFTPGATCDDFDCMNPGACCINDECIEDTLQVDCENSGGVWIGPYSTCENVDCTLDCGTPPTGDCYEREGNGSPFCDDLDCCNLICDIDPFCCDDQFGEWDEFCAAQANYLCQNIPEPPTAGCASPLNGSCFESHFPGGCNNEECCELVCMLQPFCCQAVWDANCVELATEICIAEPDPGAVTPDFAPLQGYKTTAGWGEIPEELQPFVPLVDDETIYVGYGGQGMNIDAPGEEFTDDNGNGWWDEGEAFVDDNDNGVWDRPPNLYGLAGELLHEYGVDALGQGNLTRGRTTKVAVIEWAYWSDHEALQHVISEPDQTLILIPEVTGPDHATACLSIIGARDDGIGVTGIVPEAQLYFFPLTSIEEGPREMTAWTSALMTLGPGDVISCSYGPTPNLNCVNSTWVLIRMASDLGITVCASAGNDCGLLDEADDFGDSGCMVVGACSPGLPFYRLSFSNFCMSPPPDNSRGNVVHIKAWGELVAAAGYGFLYNGEPQNGLRRTYTAVFNGTSAAAPQIAGVVASLQGLAKQFYGIPMMPEQIRGALGCPGPPPPNPPPRLFGGFPIPGPCTLDFDPTEGPHRIGPLPNVAGNFGSAASAILNQSPVGYDDSPFVEDVLIIRGELLFGNHFSIKGSENSYLVIQSQYTEAGSGPGPITSPILGIIGGSNGLGIPQNPLGSIVYIATGQLTDMLVVGRGEETFNSSVTVLAEIAPPGDLLLMFAEMFDWNAGRWVYTDFMMDSEMAVQGDGDLIATLEAGRTGQFVDPFSKLMLVRLWTFGFPLSNTPIFGGVPGVYELRYDLVDVGTGQDFGEVPPVP